MSSRSSVLRALLVLGTACARPPDYSVAMRHTEETESSTAATQFRLEDFRKAGEASIRPAWERVQRHCSANTPVGQKALGCTVLAPCNRQYEQSETIPICVGIRHVGCGTGNWDASTVYRFEGGVTGFRTYPQGECPFDLELKDRAAGRFILEAVGIVHTDRPEVSEPYYGVHAETPIAVRDVWVRGFVHGIHISAGARRKPPSVANGWSLERVRAEKAEHAGVFISGPDVNGGLSMQVATVGNCVGASRWNERYAPASCDKRKEETCDESVLCAGLIDASFIFSQHLAPRSASNKDRKSGKRFPGYVIRGATNMTTVIGPYTENWASAEEGVNYAGPNVQVIGGNGSWRGPGTILKGHRLNRLAVITDDDAELALGNAAGPGSFLEAKVRSQDGSRGWALRYPADGPHEGWFVWDYARADKATAFALAGKQAAKDDVPLGSTWFIGPQYHGPSRHLRIRQGIGKQPPPPDETWPAGSRWLRADTSSVGEIAEWVLIESRGKKQWRPLTRVQ